MALKVVTIVLAADVAPGGTFTVGYPANTEKGYFYGATNHQIATGTNDVLSFPKDFSLSFGASNVTVTTAATAPTLKAGTTLFVQLGVLGPRSRLPAVPNAVERGILAPVLIMDLGAPIAGAATGFISAATGTELPNAGTKTYTPATAGTSPVDGATPSMVMDVPRAVQLTATHATSIVAMTALIYGLDDQGNALRELLTLTATGTSKTVAGKKAFAKVTQVDLISAADATANTVNVGPSNVLGLPVFLPEASFVLKESQDGAAPTAGTVVAGDTTKATSTTGDVRGTYTPNATPDGSKAFQLIAAIPNPSSFGVPQYNG